MAASRRADPPGDAPVHTALAQFVQTHRPAHLTVAFSGGLDSTVLLHGLCQLRTRFSFHLEAVHVHHGLQADADRWAAHCETVAAAWRVPLTVAHVRPVNRGEGLEAAARRLRYEALAQRAREWVLTAHHRQDQAETVLLNLLRGSGVAGLQGMRPVRPLTRTVCLGRPLLALPRRALRQYAQSHGLRWVEDDSNRNLRFGRNWVRHRLLPLLVSRFPAVETKLAQLASHMRSSQRLLGELATQDLAAVEETGRNALRVAPLLALSPHRRDNVLRHWFAARHGVPLTQQHLDALVQLLQAAPDRHPSVRIGRHVAERFQGRLFYPRVEVPAWTACRWVARHKVPFRFEGTLDESVWLLPFSETGLALKPYKKAFQAAGVPPRLRPLWPVACREGRPGFILGVAPVREAADWPEAAAVQVALSGGIG